MVKALLAIFKLIYRAPFVELLGAAAVVVGVYMLAGVAWTVIAGGVALLLKSLDLDASE